MLNLKAIRIKRNLTQQQLAELISVRKQTVSEWEREKSIPKYATLIKLKEYFNTETIDYLLEQEDDNTYQNDTIDKQNNQ